MRFGDRAFVSGAIGCPNSTNTACPRGLSAACAQAKAASLDVGPLLEKAGITQQQIDDPSVRLNVRDQIRFVNLAASALQDDFLGFLIAQLADLRELGLLYYVAASSKTQSQALQQAARYASIVNEGVSLKYVNDDDGVRTVFRYVGISRHLDRHQMEFIAAILVRMCRHLTGQHVKPMRTRLRRSEGASMLRPLADSLQTRCVHFEYFG
jgi:hypothetical protein